MKKHFAFIALAAACGLSFATGSGQPGTGNGGGGGGGGGGGAGIGVGIAGAAAASTATAGAASVAGASNTVGIVTSNALTLNAGSSSGGAGGLGGTSSATSTTGASTAAGGSVGNVAGGSIGNGAGSASIEWKAAASTAYAPNGQAPRTSCRLFAGFGGTNTSGALSGGIPIGNDQTCVSGAKMEFMDKVNSVARGTFLVDDYLDAACEVEGMSKTKGCQAYAERKAPPVAAAPTQDAYTR